MTVQESRLGTKPQAVSHPQTDYLGEGEQVGIMAQQDIDFCHGKVDHRLQDYLQSRATTQGGW